MIVLDTNVVSALMQREPEERVLAWLDKQPTRSIWITTITLFECRFGLALLPKGKRRLALETAFEQLLIEDIEHRVLPFDAAGALHAANLAAARQRAGRSVDMRDTQIAGIALACRASIATRNLRHFEGLDVAVVDPWAHS
jgi:toxin FitB